MDPNQQFPPTEPQAHEVPAPQQPVVQMPSPVGAVPPTQPVAPFPTSNPAVEPQTPQVTPPVQPVPQMQPSSPFSETAVPIAPQPQMQAAEATAAPTAPSAEQTFQWQAPEYLSSTRSKMWYILFWGGVVVSMAIAAFVIKSITFAVLIPVMAAALTIYTHRPARMMQYVVSSKGLYINDQIHGLAEFRGFGVQQGESMPSLLFIPTKRFRPSITVYFPQEIGEPLVNFIGIRLPMQETKLDAFDKVVRRLHL